MLLKAYFLLPTILKEGSVGKLLSSIVTSVVLIDKLPSYIVASVWNTFSRVSKNTSGSPWNNKKHTKN